MTSPADPPDDAHGTPVHGASDPQRSGSHRLGPHVVGQRVVVRRMLPGLTGPTGGPAMTDVLGTCTAWDAETCTIRLEDADAAPVTIRLADIVSGKPVPPRPSVRMRVSPREIHLHTLGRWPDASLFPLGEWVLRAAGPVVDRQHPAGRLLRRANSTLAMGSPGVEPADAADRIRDFYAARHQPALAQVVAGGEEEATLGALGWRVEGPDSHVELAPTARLQRTLAAPPPGAEVVEQVPRDDGLRLATARIGADASVNLVLDGDWLTLDDLWVTPERRREGLARAVLAEGLDWAASQGATTTSLAVTDDNVAARTLYAHLGFSTHHTYRYLTPPA